jgi:signal transduction histidine kinase
LIGTSLVFLLLFMAMYQQRLRDERAHASVEVNRLLQASLENAMLKRDLDGLRTIVRRLGRQPGITSVMIVNPKDEVRFASHDVMLGTRFDREQSIGCVECHMLNVGERPLTVFLRDEQGREVLRSVKPVANRPECLECHGTVADHPYNGLLVVDYDAATVREDARDTTLALMAAGAVVLFITLVGGLWFMTYFVLRPVRRLTRASEAMAAGKVGTRVGLSGRDELAVLGARFDTMAASLQQSFDREREQRLFLQALVDAIPDGIRVIDPQYRTLLTNRAFRTQLGLDGRAIPVGEPCHRSSHGRDEPCPPTLVTCPIEEIGRHHEPLKCLHRFHRVDGGELEVEVFAAPMVVPVDGEETTLVVEAVRDLRRQVLYSQEQKLSDLGQLAAGVAHEVRNPLSSVHLALRTMLDQGCDKANVQQYLTLVSDEIEKCLKVSDRLLALSATPSEQQQLVPVNPAVSDTASLLNYEGEQRKVTIRLDLDSAEPRILASDSELRMVVLNLMQNAFHAMPDGGELVLSTRATADLVVLTVRDSGRGIRAVDLPRIFHPFFSHRADGSQGTGLGLSITHNLVSRHDGTIEVDSRPGEGALFTVTFPNPDRSQP